jgi:hypothetical protein
MLYLVWQSPDGDLLVSGNPGKVTMDVTISQPFLVCFFGFEVTGLWHQYNPFMLFSRFFNRFS